MALDDSALFELATIREQDRIRVNEPVHRERRSSESDAVAATRPLAHEIGWGKGDSSRTIWGLSHGHLANAIDEFSKDSDEEARESLVREANAARAGFAWLAELGQRAEVTEPLATACDEFMRGVAQRNTELAMHGYSALEMIVSRLREQFGEDLGRSWKMQAIDEEFDRVFHASASLVDRLMHENLTDTDTANTYELAVKISHGWSRLVHGSYFLGYSEPYSEAVASIVSGMRDHCPEQVRAGTEKMVALAGRLSQVSATIVAGDRPQKGDPVVFGEGVPGGLYLAATDGHLVEGYTDQWSVEVVLTDPRVLDSGEPRIAERLAQEMKRVRSMRVDAAG
jgi:hypothetical protein